MWAFALVSFVTGVAGALLGSSSHVLYNYQFPTSQSIMLFAVVLMGGIYTMWGALVAAFLFQIVPAAFTVWGISNDWADDPVRRRRAAGADDRTGRHRPPVAARSRAGSAELLFGLARRAAPAGGRAP